MPCIGLKKTQPIGVYKVPGINQSPPAPPERKTEAHGKDWKVRETADSSIAALEARRQWRKAFKMLGK
jgi:hypothetical protein